MSINGNLQSYQNVLTIYDNVNELEPMKRIETSLYELDAVTSMVSNNLVVYLQEEQNVSRSHYNVCNFPNTHSCTKWNI